MRIIRPSWGGGISNHLCDSMASLRTFDAAFDGAWGALDGGGLGRRFRGSLAAAMPPMVGRCWCWRWGRRPMWRLTNRGIGTSRRRQSWWRHVKGDYIYLHVAGVWRIAVLAYILLLYSRVGVFCYLYQGRIPLHISLFVYCSLVSLVVWLKSSALCYIVDDSFICICKLLGTRPLLNISWICWISCTMVSRILIVTIDLFRHT